MHKHQKCDRYLVKINNKYRFDLVWVISWLIERFEFGSLLLHVFTVNYTAISLLN